MAGFQTERGPSPIACGSELPLIKVAAFTCRQTMTTGIVATGLVPTSPNSSVLQQHNPRRMDTSRIVVAQKKLSFALRPVSEVHVPADAQSHKMLVEEPQRRHGKSILANRSGNEPQHSPGNSHGLFPPSEKKKKYTGTRVLSRGWNSVIAPYGVLC